MTSLCRSVLDTVRFDPSRRHKILHTFCFANLTFGLLIAGGEEAKTPVSYYHEVRPILQANCQGCHQPAKHKGGYVMTDFKRLLEGGDTEGVAIVPGKPAESVLVKMVQPHEGEVRMPKGKAPLSPSDVSLLTTWIEQGAQDD